MHKHTINAAAPLSQLEKLFKQDPGMVRDYQRRTVDALFSALFSDPCMDHDDYIFFMHMIEHLYELEDRAAKPCHAE